LPDTLGRERLVQNDLCSRLENRVHSCNRFGEHYANRFIACRKRYQLFDDDMRLLNLVVDYDRVVTMLREVQKGGIGFGEMLEHYREILESAANDADGIVVATEKKTAEHTLSMLGAAPGSGKLPK